MSLGLGNEVTRKALSMLAVGAAVLSMAACGQMKTADELAGNTSNAGNSGTAASSCPTDVNNDFTGTIRVGWQAIPNADLVVKDQGLLEACLPKAKIQWSQFSSGATVVQAFGSHSLDLALAGSVPAVTAVSAPLNIPVKVVWINDVIGKGDALVARNGISTVKGLKGKTIGVPFGSTDHFSLLSTLNDAGLSDDDVKLVNLDPDKMPAVWQRGEIDAAYVWEPVLARLKDDGGTVVISSDKVAAAGSPTYDLELATDDFIRKNPSVLETWVSVENHALGQVQRKEPAAVESIANQLGQKPSEVETQIDGNTFLDATKQEKEFDNLPKTLSKTAKFLKDQGKLSAVNGDYSSTIYADAIRGNAK